MSATYGCKTKSKHELNSNKSQLECKQEANANESENINQHKSNTERELCLLCSTLFVRKYKKKYIGEKTVTFVQQKAVLQREAENGNEERHRVS